MTLDHSTALPNRQPKIVLLLQTEPHGGEKCSDVTLQQTEKVPEENEKGTLQVSTQDSEEGNRAYAKTAFWVLFAG